MYHIASMSSSFQFLVVTAVFILSQEGIVGAHGSIHCRNNMRYPMSNKSPLCLHHVQILCGHGATSSAILLQSRVDKIEGLCRPTILRSNDEVISQAWFYDGLAGN